MVRFWFDRVFREGGSLCSECGSATPCTVSVKAVSLFTPIHNRAQDVLAYFRPLFSETSVKRQY